jgi:8-oxo-dGTP diphosphatase
VGADESTVPLYERDPEAWRAYLAEGNARQARKRVSVDALIHDDRGHILVVKPTYKPGWDLPGGMVEANEPPLAALRRELTEELGLSLSSGRLLCIDWVSPHGPWDDLLGLIFDGGLLSERDRDGLALCDDELSGYRFVPVEELAEMLSPRLWRRAEVALGVLRGEEAAPRYLEDGQPPRSLPA